MQEYLNLCKYVLNHGEPKNDRTNTGTISYFGLQTRYDLKETFPMITTKKIHWKSVLVELLWFIKGDTNIQYLVKNGVRIWNEWPFKAYCESSVYDGIDMKEFIERIKTNDEFAKKWGNLGPVYGKQWRNFNGVDQLSNLIDQIKTNPNSRRLILTAWNPQDISKMALPPCHTLMQFYVTNNGYLNCQLYQRSADIFLGVPFNISSYSLLTYIIAHLVGLKPGTFVHTIGDGHIYSNHIEQIKEQITRQPFPCPKLIIKRKPNKIEDYQIDDFELLNYKHHPHIIGKVAV